MFAFLRRADPSPGSLDDWVARTMDRFMGEHPELGPFVQPITAAAAEGDVMGIRLREERKRLGLTQIQLAEHGGVSLSSQKLYEKGRSPACTYLAVLDGIGVDVLYVLTGRREAPR
ncbi:helix-turn-helix domain-containing protein [Albimonas pacifica]|uniref:Helix-turn-helix domain-containing protein n=1 Tax=Albimonas pacifica TaxID=1114924 RepID=A0A1I3PVB0_9RHOB|nr:helix-turn-helix transcriptional regulator [Albimonas pacifica]SFJ25217.1 Helix-turn-helix domain-containing protein [Albimonas pacifica]